MSTPNPLVPQGSLPPSQGKGKSNIRLVILGVAAVHAVFIVGLLVQGCNKPQPPAPTPEPTVLPPLPAADTNFFPAPAPAPGTGTTAVVAAPMPTPLPEPVPAPAPTPSADMAPSGATKEYVVLKGDSFSTIAKKSGTTAAAIAKANPGVDSSKLKIGQKLVIPEGATAATAGVAAPAAGITSSNGSTTSYTVKTGDTLTKIAKNNKTTVQALRAANGLKTDRIHVGQKLKVPSKGTETVVGSGPIPDPAPIAASVPVPAPAAPAPAVK
ncbi:MAG TPA: LysM peptidoglycan-binding domain-containing protein [Roseimicrobium sp.]|nr:LysM peptidoglycan-binding domain-containing protein [Roseimicrobium sp.]